MPPLLRLPLDLLVLLLLVASWTGLGLRFLGASYRDEVLRGLVACGLGLFTYIYALLLMGLFGALTRGGILALTIGFLAVGAMPLAALIRDSDRREIFATLRGLTGLEKTLLAILLFSAVGRLLFGYAPPTGDDELVYQISLPRLYADSGRLLDTPDNFCSYYPLNAQLLFTALLSLRGVLAVKFSVWIFGLLVSFTLYHFLRDRGLARTPAMVALSAFTTSPFMTSLHGTCSSDLFSIFFGVLAVALVWKMKEEPFVTPILLGIFAGAGMGTRYYAAAWILPVVLLLWARGNARAAIRMLVVAGIVFAPWPARNILLAGNPLYPMFFFGLDGNEYFSATVDVYAATPLWIRLLLLPLQIPYGDLIWGLGLIPVALAPFALLDEERRDVVVPLFFLAVSTMLLTFVFPFRLARYFGQGFLLLAAVAGWGWLFLHGKLGHRGRKVLVAWLLVFLLVPNALLAALFGAKRIPYLLGLQSETAYLVRHYHAVEGAEAMAFIRREIPASSRILFLGPQQGLYFFYPDQTIVDMIRYPPAFYNRSSAALARGLREDGVRNVVLVRRLFRSNPDGSWSWWPLQPKIEITIPPLEAPYFALRSETRDASIYEVLPLAPPGEEFDPDTASPADLDGRPDVALQDPPVVVPRAPTR